MKTIDYEKQEKDWAQKFAEASDEALKDILIEEKQKVGWVRSRGIFLYLLQKESNKRGLEWQRE